jgi:hypothetical protein
MSFQLNVLLSVNYDTLKFSYICPNAPISQAIYSYFSKFKQNKTESYATILRKPLKKWKVAVGILTVISCISEYNSRR